MPDPGGVAGDATGGSAQGGANGAADGSAGGSPGGDDSGPGFETAAGGGEGLPDLRDLPPANSAASGAEEGRSGEPGGSGAGAATQQGPEVADDTGVAAGAAGEQPGAVSRTTGPLTPEQEVAILDAELERSTGDFDDLILKEQAEQSRRARENAGGPGETAGRSSGEMPAESSGRAGVYEGGMAGGVGTGAAPEDPVKFPPPEDIPSGDDDDVVARQLREAAMREPDPAVRERLWDEYRKYKGID